MRAPVFVVVVALAAAPLLAQSTTSSGAGRAGPRTLLPATQEIALARSAAPAGVTDSATIWVFGPSGYTVGARGTTGVACYVSRSWPASLEPHCFDAEGAATIMLMEMRRTELLHRGTAWDAVEREVADGITSGRFRLPRRPAMSWMMSSGQRLISDEGRAVGNWRPHLMIYFPYMTGAEMGLSTDDPRHAILVDGGRATSNLMIIVRDFVDVAGTAVAPPR